MVWKTNTNSVGEYYYLGFQALGRETYRPLLTKWMAVIAESKTSPEAMPEWWPENTEYQSTKFLPWKISRV